VTVAVAGAGIGGLTAALALARRGFSVSIYERVDHLEEVGAGIQLTPNALHVLLALGLGPALEASMVRLDAVLIRGSANGKLIQRLPLDICDISWGAPYAVIHRADLQAVLLAAVRREAGITLKLGQAVETVTQDTTGVSLGFASGHADVHARMLIGADGLWSSVRKSLGRKEPPCFTGKRAWRAMIAMADAPKLMQGRATGLWLGDEAHLVHYPVRGGSQLNLVAVTTDKDASAGWSAPRKATQLLPSFAGWEPRAKNLLASVADWRTWPLFDRPPDPSMAEGCIALLGDAAHPMLPFVAQGGAAAIEDAAELAATLGGPDVEDLPARLQAWSALRLPRVSRLQAEARSNGERYHWRWPLSAARNLGLKALGGRRMLERYDWIYGWKPGSAL